MKYTKGECGCKLKQLGYVITGIEYCPLHKSAPDLYEALKGLIERDDYGSIRLPTQARDVMVKALSKAENATIK